MNLTYVRVSKIGRRKLRDDPWGLKFSLPTMLTPQRGYSMSLNLLCGFSPLLS